MTTVRLRPTAFYHPDGLMPAWRFATRYAGHTGHVATLPEIIEARQASEPDETPWSAYFTTSSAEYYGVGADGRPKLIVAHGVGPMSTLEGIKQAYSWEYKDQQRRRRGGRISSEEFLALEAGHYGRVAVLSGEDNRAIFNTIAYFANLKPADQPVVFVIDFENYTRWCGQLAFYLTHVPEEALFDLLLFARLGHTAPYYVAAHRNHALAWHAQNSVRIPASGPRIINNHGAANCPYTTWPDTRPRQLETGMAIGHLLSIDSLHHVSSSDKSGPWKGLVSEVSCHEWRDGVRFVGVPAGATWSSGIGEAPQPHEVIRRNWRHLMQPNRDTPYTPPHLYLLERASDEWFTRYPKPNDGERMDEGDVEFWVRSVREVGAPQQFKTDDLFFLRYNLSRVVALAPRGANSYRIVDISDRDARGHTTVAVQFYVADVDTSGRLPRIKEIKQNYDLLMG